MKTQMIIKRAALLLTLSGMAALGMNARAQVIYVGDAAAYGSNLPDSSVWTGGDSARATFAFVQPETAYYFASGPAQTLKINEVNFFTTANAGEVLPFLALYTSSSFGDGDIRAAANYTVIWLGAAIAATGESKVWNVDVSGAGQTIQVSAGDYLVAGYYNTTPGLIANDGTDTWMADYVSLSNAIPGGIGQTLTDEWGLLNRTMAFNIGLELIPEPSTWALLFGGAALLALLRRRS